jgi:DNA-binding response OmpR family regulator
VSLQIIQIIEDDPAHAGLLDRALRKARYRTNVAPDGQTGLTDIKRLRPALVLLDVMLPGLDGFEVCRRLREDEQTSHIPIIMLTALASEEHRVAGLEFGADDFIPKPFSPREVVSRVRAVLRRTTAPVVLKEDYLRGDLRLVENYVVVSWRGRRLDLSGAEWTVLRRLARDPSQVVTREELIQLVWGTDGLEHEQELDRLVGGLKWKLHPPEGGGLATVPSIGYLLEHSPA